MVEYCRTILYSESFNLETSVLPFFISLPNAHFVFILASCDFFFCSPLDFYWLPENSGGSVLSTNVKSRDLDMMNKIFFALSKKGWKHLYIYIKIMYCILNIIPERRVLPLLCTFPYVKQRKFLIVPYNLGIHIIPYLKLENLLCALTLIFIWVDRLLDEMEK